MIRLFKNIDQGTRNVIFLGVCFLILFSSDNTVLNLEKTLTSSIHVERKDFSVDGYNLLALLYILFGVSLWLGPAAISVIGLRASMTVASILYTLYTAAFAVEEPWALYLGSVSCGIGAGLLWTAEGKYLISNSSMEVVSRNAGIFSSFMSSSLFFGNIYAYFHLKGKKYIDRETRLLIISAMTTLCAISIVAFGCLPPVVKRQAQVEEIKEKSQPLKELKKTWLLLKTKEMLIICVSFGYIGMQQAFFNGIYGPSIGFTLAFGNAAEQLVPLSSIFAGIGLLTGGCFHILLGKWLSKLRLGRRLVFFAGTVVQLISYALIYINIPSSAVFGNTSEKAYINSNVYIALLCSALIGFGDTCLGAQGMSIIASMFPEESAQSVALANFTKSLFVSITFFSSTLMPLHIQLVILAVSGITAASAFCFADHISIKRNLYHIEDVIKTT